MNYEQILAENTQLKTHNARLQYELDALKRLLYSRRSERFVPEQVPAEQLNMFSVEEPVEEEAPVQEVITYKRRKPTVRPHPGRAPIPSHFPEEVEVIEPEEDTTDLIKIGEERTEWVDYTPASLVKKVIIRPQYARQEADERTKVLIGSLPSRPIQGSLAGATLLAWIIVSKYVDHLPFYRQIKRIEREYQWKLHKSTINSWFVAVCTLLEPLYEVLRKKTIEADYIQADESRINVLTIHPTDKTGKTKQTERQDGKKQQLGWMWVVHNPETGYVLFNYEDNRSRKGAASTLEHFTKGYLQTDGYASYNQIAARPGVHRLGCLAHVRRKFFEAQGNDPKRAAHALKLIQVAYSYEEQSREMSPEARKVYREVHVLPVYEALKSWLDEESVKILPKSPIGQAFTYAQNQWPTLMTFFEDGRLQIDNNPIEHKIRPLALGRKNYLFAGSHQGAQRSAMMYSFFATCRQQGINPYEWLIATLNKINDTRRSELSELLPGEE